MATEARHDPAAGGFSGRRPQPDDERDASQLDVVCAAAESALAVAGEVRRRLRIGRSSYLLRFSGRTLADTYLAAMAAPAEDDGPADVEVLVWESGVSGVGFPRLEDDGARPAARRAHDRRIEKVYQRGVETFTAVDHHARRAVVWVPDARTVPTNEVACPLRMLFHLWGRRHGDHLLHGGAVGLDTGGVLIAGRSGIGKSTIALACLGNGLAYAGDDYVVVSVAPRELRVHAVYTSGKLQPDQLPQFPQLAPARLNPGADDKPVFLLAPSHARFLTRGFPLRAIVIPRVTGAGRPRLVPARPAAAIASIAPSTVFQLPFSGPDTMSVAATLASRFPTYFLDMGPRLDEVPARLRQLLEADDA